MGIDCRITLPDRVRVDDVATLIGIYDKLPKERRPLDRESWVCRVSRVAVESVEGVPTCVRIRWPRGEVLYHFEWDQPGRGLMPPSTPFWIATGCRLVRFFGGSINYHDDDMTTANFKRPWRDDCFANDGPAWTAFQQRLMDEDALSVSELLHARRFAAYDEPVHSRLSLVTWPRHTLFSLN